MKQFIQNKFQDSFYRVIIRAVQLVAVYLLFVLDKNLFLLKGIFLFRNY
jgi:hypothetical protein